MQRDLDAPGPATLIVLLAGEVSADPVYALPVTAALDDRVHSRLVACVQCIHSFVPVVEIKVVRQPHGSQTTPWRGLVYFDVTTPRSRRAQNVPKGNR